MKTDIHKSMMMEVRLFEIWLTIQAAMFWISRNLLKIWLLNPFSMIQNQQKQLNFIENSDELAAKPSFRERIADLFQSDHKRRDKLLNWVQTTLKKMDIIDFTTSWQDGIALCALIEYANPGNCPHYHLLKPHNRVNNCRIGIKLTQKYLGLKKMSLTPEEMAIADIDTQHKIIQLVQMIKWKCSNSRRFSSCSALILDPLHKIHTPAAAKEIMASGSGLKLGIVGKKCKFHIITTPDSWLDLHVDIRGPNNEINSEKITSVCLDVLIREHTEDNIKYIFDNCGNTFIRQKSIEHDQQDIISFDYQCVGNGRFLVTYIPRSSGIHVINIKSKSYNIEGSPYEVKINDFVGLWNITPKTMSIPFDQLPAINESQLERSRSRSQKYQSSRNHHQCNTMVNVSKQLTIMRRRVLKRVITKKGTELIIHDLSSSPTMSRQNSIDISDFSEDEIGNHLSPLHNPRCYESQECNFQGLPSVIGSNEYTQERDIGISSTPSPNVETRDIEDQTNVVNANDYQESSNGDYKSVANEAGNALSQYKIIIDDSHVTNDLKNPEFPNRLIPSRASSEGITDSCGEESSFEDDTHEQIVSINNDDEAFTWDIPKPKMTAIRSLSDGSLKNTVRRKIYPKRCRIQCTKIRTLRSASLRKSCFGLSDLAQSDQRLGTDQSDYIDSSACKFKIYSGQSEIVNVNEPTKNDGNCKSCPQSKSLDSHCDNTSLEPRSEVVEIVYRAPQGGSGDLINKQNNVNKTGNKLHRQQTVSCYPYDLQITDNIKTEAPNSTNHKKLQELKLKVDASTQVTSDEIKSETGWKSIINSLRRRNVGSYMIPSVSCSSLPKASTKLKLQTLQQILSYSRLLPSYVHQTDTDDCNSTEASNEVSNVLIHKASVEPPLSPSHQSRQSTVDSGIDDSQRDILTGIYNDNGHRKIQRNAYPWEIDLDPNLTKESTNSSLTASQDEDETRYRLSRTLQAAVHQSVCKILSGSSMDSPDIYIPDFSKEDTAYSDTEISSLDIPLRRRIFKHVRMRRQLSSRSSSSSIKTADICRDATVKNVFYNYYKEHLKTSNSSAEDSPVFCGSSPFTHQRGIECDKTMLLDTRPPKLSNSSDESYCGFGLSKNKRTSLLGNIEGFQNLTAVSDERLHVQESPDPSPSSGEELTCFSDIEVDPIGCEPSNEDTLILDPYDITSITADSSITRSLENEQSSEDFLEEFIGNNPHLLPYASEKTDDPVCLSNGTLVDNTSAFGTGLTYGMVDIKNHFQVWAEQPNNGCLTVGVNGPRLHCVRETSINYTGSNLYEVTYEVSLPGYYIISVKWSDKHLPNSPFTCKVE